MKTELYKSETRGYANHGWLIARHSFSFANYYDPERVHFGALRVLNDDIIEPAMGFGRHPHDNMEIITIPLQGQLMHKDSMDHEQTISENEVQVMSAGTGIFHSEFNASNVNPINLFQIWIFPDSKNHKPSYDQKWFDPEESKSKWQFLVSPVIESALKINQTAQISRATLNEGENIAYEILKGNFGCYIIVIEGEVEINGNRLKKRDAIGIVDSNKFEIIAKSNCKILNIEVPDYN